MHVDHFCDVHAMSRFSALVRNVLYLLTNDVVFTFLRPVGAVCHEALTCRKVVFQVITR